MAEAETEVAQPESGLQKLVQKYQTNREEAHRIFESSTQPAVYQQRISQAPSKVQVTGIGDIYKEMAGIRSDLAELADDYGRLEVTFRTLVGKDKLYGLLDALKIKGNKFIGRRGAARKIRVTRAKERGDSIEYLANQMGEVLGEMHQNSIQGKAQSTTLQQKNITHMRYLDRELITALQGGQYTDRDLVEARLEVQKLQQELADIEGVLLDYEGKIQVAKAERDLDTVSKFSQEVSEVLNIKYAVLDGQLSAEGVVSEIRRDMLDKAEAAQSARGAIAASKANYQTISLLTDAFAELEIKYRYAMNHMMPVFTISAQAAGLGMEATEQREALVRVSDLAQRLLEADAKLASTVAEEVFELLQTPLFDPEKATQIETQMQECRAQLNQRKEEWAEVQQRLTEIPQSPHYATPT